MSRRCEDDEAVQKSAKPYGREQDGNNSNDHGGSLVECVDTVGIELVDLAKSRVW